MQVMRAMRPQFAWNFEFIRLNPSESDCSIFQSHRFMINDEMPAHCRQMMNGWSGRCRGGKKQRLTVINSQKQLLAKKST